MSIERALLKLQRRWLRAHVKQWVIPEFEKLGFALTPVIEEMKSGLPFGTLRRARGEVIDVVELDFYYPQGHAGFRIFLASMPSGPWMFQGETFRNEDVPIGWLPESYEMPRGMKWFKVKRWPWSPAPVEEDYERLAKWVASMVPEAEAALTSGRCGPHVRYVRMHR
jgi:hypothetical protein